MIKWRRMKAEDIKSRICPAILVIVGCLVVVYGKNLVDQGRDSRDWPTVPGRVIASEIVRDYQPVESRGISKDQTVYNALVKYEFWVNGKRHESNRVHFLEANYPGSAHIMADRFSTGQAVTVSYSPTDADDCVLEPGVRSYYLLVPLVGLGMVVCGARMVINPPPENDDD